MSEGERATKPAVGRAAHALYSGFLASQAEFEFLTRRARDRFAARDWHGHQADARSRLRVYRVAVDRLQVRLAELLGADLRRREPWIAIKHAYRELIADQQNAELCETFFNSMTRRVFSTVGVDPDIEFVTLEETPAGVDAAPGAYRAYPGDDLAAQLDRVLDDVALSARWARRADDVRRAATRVRTFVEGEPGSSSVQAVEFLRNVFYRGKQAFLIGRIRRGPRLLPLVLGLVHGERGVEIDAVLVDEDLVSILFSFTRSYFLVDTRRPRDEVRFLRTIMPRKPIAELYIALGFIKHGKTELYRALQRHLILSKDRFDFAQGERGMVMLVFAPDHADLVFKVIRDEFDYPKKNTRREVLNRYKLVFEHDRVGRLVDAQEFEHLSFQRGLFADELVEALCDEASETVDLRGAELVVHHLYTERKVVPLNLYLRRADPDAARRAALDYGQAIKDLATANIFPGDFLLKNFGVTRHGRVVFYDYDELCLVTDCRFRRIPPARTPEDEFAAEPWYTVAEQDVFPEEFRRFLGLAGVLRAAFEAQHADLYDVEFWREIQDRHRRGEIPDFLPYPAACRLRDDAGGD